MSIDFDANRANAAKIAGMSEAEAGAPDAWKDTAKVAVATVARRAAYVTADDVWEELSSAGLAEVREPRALGPIMSWAAKNGILESTNEHRNTERVSSHARPIRVWKSLYYANPSV